MRAVRVSIVLGLLGCSFNAPSPDPSLTDPKTLAFDDGVAPTHLDVAPPALSGGSMTITRAGMAVVADPDENKIFIVDTSTMSITHTFDLRPFDEPGRVIEDAAGRVHVALRRGGAIVSIDPTLTTMSRRDVCSAPRGLAYDAKGDSILVACAGGNLVTLPAVDGPATQTVYVDNDLRDVVVSGDNVYVTRFRSAEILTVGRDGAIATRNAPPVAADMDNNNRSGSQYVPNQPGVAWRMVASPKGAYVLHQRATTRLLGTLTGTHIGYYAPSTCNPAVASVISTVEGGAVPEIGPNVPLDLAIDIAVAPNGSVAVVAPQPPPASGSVKGGNVLILSTPYGGGSSQYCPPMAAGISTTVTNAIAVAYDAKGVLFVQSRSPAKLYRVDQTVSPIKATGWELSHKEFYDTGHAVFHTITPTGIACASCHPEGGDDGHVWNLQDFGVRRSQHIGGGILKTAPFHWDGDMDSIATLSRELFTSRMAAKRLTDDQTNVLGQWLDALPAPVKGDGRDVAGIARGEVLFNTTARCSDCHSGALFTNNKTLDVGTGGVFQVPSLAGVGQRAPYMHDGCAKNLTERLTNPACGGKNHGEVASLTPAQVADLVSYLESL